MGYKVYAGVPSHEVTLDSGGWVRGSSTPRGHIVDRRRKPEYLGKEKRLLESGENWNRTHNLRAMR